MTIMFLLLCLVSFVLPGCSLTNTQTNMFTERSSSGELRNIEFDPHTNSLYVGSINTLYWLSSDLRLLNSLELGPLYDNVNCPFNPQDDCVYPRVAMPAINQALAIDAKNRVLIVCSTLYYGSCQTIDLRSFVPRNYFHKPIVSNDPNGSTVMFVGPGIESGGVLYVGTSYSNVGLPAYQDTVGMISVRNLFSLDLSWKSSTTSTSINLLPKYRKNFPVNFIGGFHYKNFVYFFVNHPISLTSQHPMSSFLIRICKDDSKMQSFIEIPIECKIGGTVYQYITDVTLSTLGKRLADSLRTTPDAAFGVFNFGSDSTRKDSAVCVYSMDSIEQKFQETLQSCYNGASPTGPAFMTTQVSCTKKNVQIPRDFCGEQDGNHPLSGSNAIQPISSAAVKDALASAILVKTAENETVVFVGIQSGTVLKLRLRGRDNLSPVYGSVKLHQDVLQPIKDMKFGLGNNSIYVLTSTAVYSMKTYDCGLANTCVKCIEDPHCGWCASSKKCSVKSSCNSATLWLTETCPLIVGLSQSQISHDRYTSTRIAITVNLLPASHRHIQCQMDDKLKGTSELAQSTLGPANVVTCMPFSRAPHLPNNRTHVNLSLTVLVDHIPWVTTSINVYNCGHLSNCASCMSTMFSCKWCASRHQCMATVNECTLLSGIQTSIDHISKCPRVEFSADKGSAFMASGTKKSFTVLGYNILKIYQDKLKCLFRMNNQLIRSRAAFRSTEPAALQTIITCDPVLLDYPGNHSYISVPLDIVWNDDHPLDKSTNLGIRLYKCRNLVSTCGQCLTLDAEYKCGWCGDHCSLESQCIRGLMNKNHICPNPQITLFSPLGGPIQGGTRLYIKGTNLGIAASDLDVTVAGQKCFVSAETYLPSQSFTCVTGPVVSPVSGTVAVTIKRQVMANSRSTFQYKDPAVYSFSPRRGPISGGSLVLLSGTNLDFGSSVTITLNKIPAQILLRNSTHIEFLTPAQSQVLSISAKVKVDNSAEIPTKEHFTYVEDPAVTSVDPKISLISGGNQIDIRGSNLNSVQKPLMIVYVGHENRTAACRVSSTTFLQCVTPDLRDLDYTFDPELQLKFGLIMDNARHLLNIPNLKSSIKPLTYYPLPSMNKFRSTMKYKKGEMIVIQGKNVANLSKFRDLNITVGGVKSEPVSEDSLQLAFRPPENPRLNRNGLALVAVQLGNFYEELGYLDYKVFPLRLVLGVVLGIGLTMIASVVLLFVCVARRRKRLAKKQPPKLRDLDYKGERANCNSYSENNSPNRLEAMPLKSNSKDIDDDVFMEDACDKEGELYFQGLLKRIDNASLRKAAREVFISQERIELSNLLGRGHFGAVFAATLRDENMENPMRVAVKTVEDTCLTSRVVESFLKEGVTMKKFDHPHVLSLLGISMGQKKEPMVVLPFMANGDLRSYVKDKSREFTARQLLFLAQQVAKGMAYLSSLNVIHRDLAARNCMIDDKAQVKVADFGLSHELYDRDYYSSKDRKAKLPIKWMALESLEDFVFTTKSDVWSFGVLMWELMTRGVTPYPDVEIFETRNYLATGRRLRKPKYCPDNIYDIMLDCWDKIPERRPTFSLLVNQIEVLLHPPKSPQQQDTYSTDEETEPEYMNTSAQQSEGDYLKPIQLE